MGERTKAQLQKRVRELEAEVEIARLEAQMRSLEEELENLRHPGWVPPKGGIPYIRPLPTPPWDTTTITWGDNATWPDPEWHTTGFYLGRIGNTHMWG